MNYIANAEVNPTRILFENGRVVELVGGVLEVGWSREEAARVFCHQVGRDVPESGSTLDLRLVEAAWHLSQSNHPVSAAAVREAHDKIFGHQDDARDAARYRWWRKWWCDNGDDCERVNSLEYDTDEPATFDAAIDAMSLVGSRPATIRSRPGKRGAAPGGGRPRHGARGLRAAA
jgi:hypothetical protein